MTSTSTNDCKLLSGVVVLTAHYSHGKVTVKQNEVVQHASFIYRRVKWTSNIGSLSWQTALQLMARCKRPFGGLPTSLTPSHQVVVCTVWRSPTSSTAVVSQGLACETSTAVPVEDFTLHRVDVFTQHRAYLRPG